MISQVDLGSWASRTRPPPDQAQLLAWVVRLKLSSVPMIKSQPSCAPRAS